jgi:hypothetical protein
MIVGVGITHHCSVLLLVNVATALTVPVEACWAAIDLDLASSASVAHVVLFFLDQLITAHDANR